MANELCALCLESFDARQLLEFKGQKICAGCRQRQVYSRQDAVAGLYHDPYQDKPPAGDAGVAAEEMGAEAVNRYVAPYLGSLIKEYSDTKGVLPGDRLWRRFLLIVIAVIVGVLVAYYGTKYSYRALKYLAFSREIAGYLQVAADSRASAAATPGSKSYSTHCVVVDQEAEALDELYYELPWKVRASGATDAGLVVLLKWGTEKAGDYYALDDKSKKIGEGFHRTCEVTVIDWTKREVIDRALVRGPVPFDLKLGRGDAYGDKPTEKLVHFICSFIAF